ncbi:hypothetical protein [Cereibacter sphaeroides]|uniref:hypothetical protein n=1 Tax=Cereibacter sphaeroides TaxID=1063 RepID=UPI001319AD47|nr:hypothetical protein [Cereibacter sphaeroides]QHA15464.1 hypothetical protein GQY06_21695 [Cereibacter sphaeroides]
MKMIVAWATRMKGRRPESARLPSSGLFSRGTGSILRLRHLDQFPSGFDHVEDLALSLPTRLTPPPHRPHLSW